MCFSVNQIVDLQSINKKYVVIDLPSSVVQIILTSDLKKIWKNFVLQPRICKKKSQSQEPFFLTVGQNNFQNKIPNITYSLCVIDFMFYLNEHVVYISKKW